MEIGRRAAEQPVALVGERRAMRPCDLHRVGIGQDDKIIRVRTNDDALNAFEQAKIDEAACRIDAATKLTDRYDDHCVAQNRILDRKRCGGLMHTQIDRRRSGARPRMTPIGASGAGAMRFKSTIQELPARRTLGLRPSATTRRSAVPVPAGTASIAESTPWPCARRSSRSSFVEAAKTIHSAPLRR